MGARYLKVEEAAIRDLYPTVSPTDMLERIPDRTWSQIGVHARRMGIHRSTLAWGNSIRDGRKEIKGAWTDAENERFDKTYPYLVRSSLLVLFSPRTWLAIQSHAEKRHLRRTREAVGREIKIGRENARKKKNAKN